MARGYGPRGLKILMSDAGYRHERLARRNAGFANREAEQEAHAAYRELFRELHGQSFGEKISDHYLNFRNRMHFGLELLSQPDEIWPMRSGIR